MADNIAGIPEETNYAVDSTYGGFRDFTARTNGLPVGYGSQSVAPNLYPDRDPFGVRSTAMAMTGTSYATSGTVTGLQMADGSWVEREELMKSERGRKLVAAEEDIRKGHRRGFLDGLFSGSLLEYLPFTQMFASVGGSVHEAGLASSFYDKMTHGRENDVTEEENMAATLHMREQKLAEDGSWWYKVGTILKQAPAFYAEFGMLGRIGQAARARKIAGIVGTATDAAAERASVTALTRAAKIGFDEYSEKAVELAAKNIMSTSGKTFAQAVRELAASPEARRQMVQGVASRGADLVEGMANAAATPSRWAPGLAQKVANIRAERAVSSALSRWSSDSVVARMWQGLRKATADSVAEGIMDLGAFGTEASTVISTLEGTAGKAALKGVLDLTVGAASRGAVLYFPKEVVSRAIAYPMGAVNKSTLMLQEAAFVNDDTELFDRATRTGMFLDLLEYVSENTGRGFGQIARAAGLKLAPKLMAPARRVAGLDHIVEANVARDAAGKISKVEYSGLFDPDRYAEVGGRLNKFLTDRFGGKVLREKVANDEMVSVTRKLAQSGISVPNPAALQASLEARAFQAGVTEDIRQAIGSDISGYVKTAVKEANKAKLGELKLHGARMFMLADWMARRQIDPIKAAQIFEQAGYDGVISEMLEERYSDFMSNLFGLDARKDTTLWQRLKNGIKEAFYFDADTGKWKPGDMLAEAFAFAVPLVARGAIMHGISRLGGSSRYERDIRDWAASYADVTRYSTAFQGRKGSYIERVKAQQQRLNDKADEYDAKVREELESRNVPDQEGIAPRVAASDAEIESWRTESQRYRTAATRSSNLLESFIASLAPRTVDGNLVSGNELTDDTVISAPVYSDAYLLSSEEEYNLALHPTEEHLRGAMSAYTRLIGGAAEAIQTQYRMDSKMADEPVEGYRKIGHWVAETALRLSGTAITGDVAFMAANPARWAANDFGVRDEFLDNGKKMYAKIFAEELGQPVTDKINAKIAGEETDARVTTSDYEAAHERTLRRIRPYAEALMRSLIAAHQTRMFSYDELEDIAVADVARDMNMEYDERTGEFYNINDESAPRVPYTSFVENPENRELIESTRKQYTETLYDVLTRGMGINPETEAPVGSQLSRPVGDILNIPRGLPTEKQVIYARVAERLSARLPQLRGVTTAQTVNPNLTIDDQVAGTAVKESYLEHVRKAILPEGPESISRVEDIDAAVARIESAHPAVLERIAQDLHLTQAFTNKEIRARNRAIAMLALRSAVVSSPNVALFSRAATVDESESRFSNPNGIIAPARRGADGKWKVAIREGGSHSTRVLASESLDQLESVLKDKFGFERVQPKVVYTSTEVFTADTAFDMIRFLGLGEEYRRRMSESSFGDRESLDPAARMDDEGNFVYSEDDAAVERARELRLAELHAQNGKQEDVWLYMPAGTERTDATKAIALRNAEDARAAWARCFQRTDDGKAIGYIAVAEDLLAQWGCSIRYTAPKGRANTFGLVSASQRGRYSISIRAMHSSGLAKNVFVPISHLNAQDYSSAMLEASLATRFNESRAYLKTFFSPIRGFLDEVDRVSKEVEDSVREQNPELADRISAFRTATVSHAEGEVRGITPQTFAMFVSAFNLFRTEVPSEWQRSVLGAHAEALVAVAPKVRKLTSYLGWTGIVDRMLGGAGLELEALKGDSPNINAGLARYYALYNPWYIGSTDTADVKTRKSLKDAVDAAYPDGFAAFAERVASNVQASVAPSIPRPTETTSREARQTTRTELAPVTSEDNNVPSPATPTTESSEDPITALRDLRAVVVENSLTPEETLSALMGGDTQEPTDTAPDSDEVGPEEIDDMDVVDVDVDNFMVASAPVQMPVDVTPTGTTEVIVPPTKSGLLPSEVKTISRLFQRMATAMLGAPGRLSDLREIVYGKLVPDLTAEDWKALREAWESVKDDGKYASDWDFGVDGDEEGILPDGVEGNNSRAVSILKSKAMDEFLSIMDLVTPTSGRDFQPFIEDMRSNLKASAYLIPEGADPDVTEAIDFVSKILNPRAETAIDNATGRDSMWRHRMSLFDDGNESGRRTIAKYVRALLGKEGEPPVNDRAAILLTYFTMLPTNVRMQLASLAGASSPATPTRLEFRRINGRPVFLLREVPKRTGSMSFGVLSSTFARLAGKTAAEINEVASTLEDAFRKELNEGALSVRSKTLVDAGGKGILNTYARILAPIFGADSTLVTVLVSANLRNRLYGTRNTSIGSETSEWTQFLNYFGERDEGTLPDAASTLIQTLRGLASITTGKADRKTLVDRALDMFQSDSPDRRNITGATTSLQGSGVWKRLLRAYAESKPTSVMNAEVNPERSNRPSSSLAITMPGVEPSLQQFMDRRSDDLGFEGVLRTWFRGYAELPDDEFRRRVAELRRTMQWPGVSIPKGVNRPQSVVSASQIVAKSISKTAMASEVIAGCEAAYELEGMTAETRPAMIEKYGGEFVSMFQPRNMVYVPVYSGDHASSILVQVPLAAEFREAGMSYDKAAELVSTWVGLDLLGTDAKRSATTSHEGPGTSMWDYAYDEKGNVLKDSDGKDIHGHAYVGILWSSDPAANNEALIGTTGILGYGSERQKEMAKDPKSGTIKCHVMATGEDTVYGPLLSLIKSLSVSVDGSHGDFLEGDPKKFINDFAKGFLDGLDGKAQRNSILWSDFDSIKLGVANSKTIGVSDGAGKSVALMKHVFSQLRKALSGELKDENGNPIEIGTRITGKALDDLVGSIDWVNVGGTGKKGRQLLSQLLDGAEIREVPRPGDNGGHKMFSLMFRSDSLMAFTVANVSHAAKSELSRTPRNYMLDALAMQRTLRTWDADDMNGRADQRIFNNRDAVCDEVRDLVSGWGLTGAIMSRDPRGLNNLLANDEEYQALIASGEPVNGKWARDYRLRMFATNARKNNLNVPILGTDYALVSNAAWVGSDGKGHSHSASQMFNDTLQGPRAIADADKDFLCGHRRAGLCNVNCVDPSFRYGLYVDDAALLNEFSKEDEVSAKIKGLSGYRCTVAILDAVISKIVEHESTGDYSGPYHNANQYKSWRERLADCLLDHHGNKYSKLYRSSKVGVKGKDGKAIIDPATGRQKMKDRTTYLWETVSFADLFTNATTDSKGRMMFDRTAVYEGMHDSSGVARTYLGGTMFGFPRTPSYNGSMVFQTLRAALPVTETYSETAKEEWKPGRDAMVAPDPFTLKVLGCDHDGDKAKLYMLSPVRRGHFLDPKSLLGGADPLTEELEADSLIKELGLLDRGFYTLSEPAQKKLDNHISRLVDLGILEYERIPDGKNSEGKTVFKEGALVLTRDAKARISNVFVQSLFDMSRMLPFYAKGGESVIAGEVRDGGVESGSAFGSTMAAPGPDYDDGRGPARRKEAAWDVQKVVDGVLGEKIFDEKSGKILRKPRVAARAQDSAARASEARAIMVNIASSFHFGYMCGFPIGPFASRRDISGKEWIDFMYHLDHLSNMTFDDIKEQICSRLGVTPGMIETIVADMLNDATPGHFPTTDAEFLASFCKYAMSANDKQSSRHWMSRAADPTDYEFRKLADGFDMGEFFRALHQWARVAADRANAARTVDKVEALFDSGILGAADGKGLKNPINGYVYWLCNVCPKSRIVAEMEGFSQWLLTTGSIKDMKSFSNAINFSHVDPAADTASDVAERLDDGFDIDQFMTWIGDGEGDRRDPSFGKYDTTDFTAIARMRAAVVLMYDRGVGEVVASRGFRAVDEFKENRRAVLSRYTRSEPANGSSTPGALVNHALFVVPRLSKTSNPLQVEANAQSVDMALAAFNDVPFVVNSPITTRNAYNVLDTIGRRLASLRHPDKPGTNVTLDVLYGIETMLDVVARFTMNSYAGTQLGIFNYLNEVPNASSWYYDPKNYGGAATGLSRIILGMGKTGGQISELRNLVRRVVIGRELDSDGVLGSLPYASARVQDDIRSASHYWKDPAGHKHWREGVDVSFALSTENLKKMKELLVGSKSVKEQANRSQAESGRARNLLKVEKRELVGDQLKDTSLPGALDELISVFEALDKAYGKGFTIEPSALFGQLLPLYSVISSRTEGAPDAESTSLMVMFPETYASWSKTAAGYDDPRYAMFVMANMAVNWAPVRRDDQTEEPSSVANLKPRQLAAAATVAAEPGDQGLRALAEAYASAGDGERKLAWNAYKSALRKSLVYGERINNPATGRNEYVRFDATGWENFVDPKTRHVLSVFDGDRGVLFKNTLAVLRNEADRELRLPSRVAKPATQPVTQPASALPTVTTKPESKTKVKDTYVQQVADRMAGIMKMWDMGRVEYTGGNTFTICGRFHEAQGAYSANDRAFETRINVEVLPEGEPVVSDERLAKILNGKNFRQSLANWTGKTLAELEEMANAGTLFAFAKANRPVGISRSYRPGSTDLTEVLSVPGEWRVDAERLGVLTGHIKLSRQDTHENVVYHEFFHSVMGFMRALGSFSADDIAALQKRYGKDNKFGDKWFNEEAAAEEFRALVNDGTAADKSVNGIWEWVQGFLDELWQVLFDTSAAFDPDRYSNEVRSNPLSAIVLTGKFTPSRQVSEPKDFLGKIDAAIATYDQVTGYPVTGNRAFDILNAYYEANGPAGYNVSDTVVSEFNGFLNDINAIGYPDKETRRAAIREVIRQYNEGHEGGSVSTEFSNVVKWFAREYGPVSVPESDMSPIHDITVEEVDAISDQELETLSTPAPTVPNPIHESSISDMISGDEVSEFLDGAEVLTKAGFDEEESFMCAPAHESLREAMRSVDRMDRPYTKLFSLAREIGLVLRDGIEAAPEESVTFVNSLKDVTDYAVGKDRALNAMRKVASLYGVDISDPVKAERLLFRAVNELAGQLGEWTRGFGKVRLADGTKRSSAKNVSSATIAAAVSTSLGVRPRDIAEAAIEDIRSYVRQTRSDGTTVGRYPEDNSFVINVINPIVSALSRLSCDDPSGLMFSTSEGLVDDVIKSIHAGTAKGSGGVNSDGTYRDFEISKNPEASDNPYFETNRLRYMDHEGNPDLHSVLHRALDAAYMIKASMKFHRAIGFEPGRVEDFAVVRQLAPNAPEPMTGAEMMAAMSIAPEQLTQDGFEVVSDTDQTWFTANHPEAWLDSMLRPGEFGNTNFREMAQGMKRQIAGFHTRSNSLNVLMARRFGLDVMPGQGVHARIEGQTSDFVLDGGSIKHLGKGKGIAVEKYDAYNDKVATVAGEPVVLELNDQRTVDLYLKACKVKYSGGSKIITGVDGITFSLKDLHDADWYSWDNVQKRAKTGRANGYSPVDTALVRMHRQLADDISDISILNQNLWRRDESWDGVLGKSGLDLYDRFVNATVAALKDADKLTKTRDDEGRPMLLPNEVNDFVLGKLEDAGLVVAVEKYSKGLGRHAKTEASICIEADSVIDFFNRSDAKRKLLSAGRKEEELSYDGYVKPFHSLWNEVRGFIADSPFLSDGDGAFFHNATTPLPFAQGSGFFMYYANRSARGSDLQTDTETMNRWETAFSKLVDSPDKLLPAVTADAELLLLFKELFHTNEKDVESIRAALADGEYTKLSPALTENANVGDLAKAIYMRMTGMLWHNLGDPTVKEATAAIGEKSIGRMVRMYEKHRADDMSLITGGVGMTDELVYKMTGCLPHNDQLGHAVQRTIDGVTNAYAFRATLYNMLTTPDEKGMPTCYALPAENASDTGGLPDEVWGSIAKWWAVKNGLSYDITKSGIWNARNVYAKIHSNAKVNKVSGTLDVAGTSFGELKRSDIDQRSIEGFMAQATTPEEESKTARLSGFRAGGYALGYAKHLLQSTRGLGQTWQRAMIHRALAYSKGLSVSFSYFFPLTTRFESPIAATGLLATAGGNFAPELVREHSELLSKLQSPRGNGWLTKDFTGQKDIFDMMDSNDPYLSELYHWAGALGLTISDANANAYEGQRAILEEDMRKAVSAAKAVWGSKVASRLQKILNSVLLKGGERAFTYHMNATKLAVASQICTRMQIEAARAGKAFDPVRDLKKYSNYINSEIGGIDPLEYAWAHPAAKNLLSQLFFSWEWTRGSWATGYNAILEQLLFGGHGVTREQRKFLPGRMARLFLTVGIGYPMVFQMLSKGLGLMILNIAGIDPDDDTLDEETRKLARMVIDTPWMTWNNEDKTTLTAWDITPLAAAMGAAFPNVREFLGDHPFLRAVPAIAAAVMHKPWLLAAAFPMYTGKDPGNKRTAGRHIYAHSGKQLWEDPRWWTDTTNQFFSKLSMPLQRIAEGIMGRSLTWMDHPKGWAEENDVLRWINPSMDGAAMNLLRAFVPFSATSVGNFGDAGFLSMVGPVQMGASSSDVQKRMQTYLSQWASSDRRGYSFGGPARFSSKQSYGQLMALRRPEIAHLVREAMFNGMTEKDAFRLVGNAVGRLTGDLYNRILDTMPLTADGDYDVQKMGKLLRESQRLGRLPQDVFDSLRMRLEQQSRWSKVSMDARLRMANIILNAQKRPYDTEPVKFDY